MRHVLLLVPGDKRYSYSLCCASSELTANNMARHQWGIYTSVTLYYIYIKGSREEREIDRWPDDKRNSSAFLAPFFRLLFCASVVVPFYYLFTVHYVAFYLATSKSLRWRRLRRCISTWHQIECKSTLQWGKMFDLHTQSKKHTHTHTLRDISRYII